MRRRNKPVKSIKIKAGRTKVDIDVVKLLDEISSIILTFPVFGDDIMKFMMSKKPSEENQPPKELPK